MYQINFSKKGLKSLRKLPISYQIQIKRKSEQLSLDPFKLDIKKLSPSYAASHRLRIGDYRLFLKIDSERKTIEIDDIERRTTQTYH